MWVLQCGRHFGLPGHNKVGLSRMRNGPNIELVMRCVTVLPTLRTFWKVFRLLKSAKFQLLKNCLLDEFDFLFESWPHWLREEKECEQGCYFCWSGAFSSENSCYRKPPKRGKFMAFPSKGGQAFRIQLMNTAHSAQTIEALKSRSLL